MSLLQGQIQKFEGGTNQKYDPENIEKGDPISKVQ